MQTKKRNAFIACLEKYGRAKAIREEALEC